MFCAWPILKAVTFPKIGNTFFITISRSSQSMSCEDSLFNFGHGDAFGHRPFKLAVLLPFDRLPHEHLFLELPGSAAVVLSCSATAMAAMAMTVTSPQALLAVSNHRQIGSVRHCAVALPPLRSNLPRRLVVVRATTQVDAGSTASSKATVPDNEVSITKVMSSENSLD